jgi:hypothetical protein
MCVKCYTTCLKYYKDCSNCNKKVIKPEDEDESVCLNCKKDTSTTKGTCTKCKGTTDADWKKLCTPCWSKENGKSYTTADKAKDGGKCKDCKIVLDADWKTQCTSCWIKEKGNAPPSTGKCTTCNKKLDAGWKAQCVPCWKNSKSKAIVL